MEEELLEVALCKRLRTEDSDHPYSVSRSGLSQIDEQYYIIKTITIDNYPIVVYVHRSLKRGYLEYFHYNSVKSFDNGVKIRYDLYLGVSDVLDGKPFFTTTKAERRKIKLKNIQNKLKNKELIIS